MRFLKKGGGGGGRGMRGGSGASENKTASALQIIKSPPFFPTRLFSSHFKGLDIIWGRGGGSVCMRTSPLDEGADSRRKGRRRDPGPGARRLGSTVPGPAGWRRRRASGATWWQRGERLAPAANTFCASHSKKDCLSLALPFKHLEVQGCTHLPRRARLTAWGLPKPSAGLWTPAFCAPVWILRRRRGDDSAHGSHPWFPRFLELTRSILACVSLSRRQRGCCFSG